ncbi:serine protease snake-like [Vespa crabro]|uniref:serine protease snake-like n=1 Tax=Vespa crabro TaxID=7445 RepID=UPI001EFF7B4B|nr:serine protease snake-like [Vespa crabro]XP_046835711.1 serine protease snake-like [Vespa crabro]
MFNGHSSRFSLFPMMTFFFIRWNFIVIFLLFILDNLLFISSENAGSSSWSNKNEEIVDYHSNPFLTNASSLTIYLYGNSNEHNPYIVNESSNINSFPAIDFQNQRNIKKKEISNLPQEQPKPFIVSPIDSSSRYNTRTKSDIKCEEYGKQFLGISEVQSLVGINTQVIRVENEQCTTPDRLITGGTIATPGEFPHMVALGKILRNGSFMLYCGATLISPFWVLTASHCTYGPNGSPTVAKIGIRDIKDEKAGTVIGIEQMIRHPSYNPPAMYADIALIKLKRTVTFNTLIKPACLYQLYDNVPMKVWISGWGVTEFGGEQSEKLQKAQLDIIDNIACSIKHNNSLAVPYGVTPSMICAGDPHGGWIKDACQGDSGGPLQLPHPVYSCLFQIIGITSFGEGCAVVNSPGVYTRVSHYLNWIEDIVWPEN